ncbi:uncharacterized protein LOC126318625 [Schistocerca gregaria]|uniref:uncharacterized protein LOC126318625 n=1 Tax=Schistocerca gregaria TaxID=7010 RepID=UPI00211F0E50|nr:uncharacterized protein LOC126318625 [Schistocerca gregaria]
MSRLMLLIQLGNDTRALGISELPSYAVLKQLAISTFPRLYASNFVFMKKDENGSMVSISDDTQLQHVQPKSTLLHLFIIPMTLLPPKTEPETARIEEDKETAAPDRACLEKGEVAQAEIKQDTLQADSENTSEMGDQGGESKVPSFDSKDTPSVANASDLFPLDKGFDPQRPIEDNLILMYDTLNARIEAFDLDAKLELAVNKMQSMLKTASKTLEDNVLEPLGRIINSKVQEIKCQIRFLKEEMDIIKDRYTAHNMGCTTNNEEAYLVHRHMKALESMGFRDREKNMKAIHAHINSIEGIVERILSNE